MRAGSVGFVVIGGALIAVGAAKTRWGDVFIGALSLRFWRGPGLAATSLGRRALAFAWHRTSYRSEWCEHSGAWAKLRSARESRWVIRGRRLRMRMRTSG
jgi:hypothetical protein